MAGKQKFGAPEVRRVETEVGETGVGVSNRTDVSYELGAEIDGLWTPFASLAEGRASDHWQRAERAAENGPANGGDTPPAGA